MKFEKVMEIVRIKQEIREVETAYTKDMPKQITSPDDVIPFVQLLIGEEDREVFLVLCLNTKNQINAVHRCHVGSINASLVTPREVFKSAILNNSTSIIVAHNHPSGNCQPSNEDIDVTRRLADCGKMLGIEVLDSIIVSQLTGISLKEKGVM